MTPVTVSLTLEGAMRKRPGKTAGRPISKHRLAELIEQATIDCYSDSEERTAFLTVIEDHLAVPFTTTLLGCEVNVVGVDMLQDETLVAICRRGNARQRIPILELPLPSPAPAGSEWIEAYRAWTTGDW
jgi:hypothetical protein